MAEPYRSDCQMPSCNPFTPKTEEDLPTPVDTLTYESRSPIPGSPMPQTGTVEINLPDRSIPRFLTNLWTMLNDESINSINWSGVDSFRVTSKEAMSKDVLPKFFKHNRLSSFTRQLRMYHFEKVKDKSTLEWKHVYLNRGNPSLLRNIRRKQKDLDAKLKKMNEDLVKKVKEQQKQILQLKYHMGILENEQNRERELRESIASQLHAVREVLLTLTNSRSSSAF